jgi:hypothetical protein
MGVSFFTTNFDNNQPYHKSKVHKFIVYIHKVCIMHISAQNHHPTMNVKDPTLSLCQIIVSNISNKDIINWFASIVRGFLSYYRYCDNLYQI